MGPRKKADATRALKRYNEQGYNVDAEDDNQIAAYWALRTTCGRVDGKTFTRYWERRKTNVEHGARSVLEYWGVPKENFPDGLPEEIKGSVVTERDLDEAELVGGGRVDHDRYFVVDCEVSRNLLKKNVRILKFYTGSQTKVGMSPGQAAGGHASTPPPATVRDQPQAVCEQKQPSEAVGNHKVVKRMLSDPSDREDVVVKRRRLFQETMGELRSGIVGAADGGKWYTALT